MVIHDLIFLVLLLFIFLFPVIHRFFVKKVQEEAPPKKVIKAAKKAWTVPSLPVQEVALEEPEVKMEKVVRKVRPENLQKMVIYSEILSKPKAFHDD